MLLAIMDAEASRSRRRRRILIGLLILLLILLPLYLWPLRGGLGGPTGATALPGARPDPRSAAALAQIPGEVWDALMGRSEADAPGAAVPAPRNLTMIAQIEEPAAGGLLGSVGESPLPESPAALARGLIVQLDAPTGPTGDEGPAGPPGDGPGTANPWDAFAPDGYQNLGGSGPWHGGGPGEGPRVPASTFAPGDPGAPEPTPEPATLLLVGSNLALLGAAAWRRRRRGSEPSASG
ncbi:MAG TPA: PEP-CTERM sorting domain-containing protein [Methylomirabilota bacterium]|nr:PEP-CTERM sorting domain-containing protein [Methylomirabilota bacterium]